MLPSVCFVAVALTCLFSGVSSQTRCNIENGVCVCGTNTAADYQYGSRSECLKVLKGDQCQVNPCRHGGICSQINMEPGFKCRCEGTGFYGLRCHRSCPKLTSRIQGEFPFECVII